MPKNKDTTSLYKITNSRMNSLRNKGYDYRDRLLIRNVNPEVFKNYAIRELGINIENMIKLWFDGVKRIKLYINYNFDKDDVDIIN